MKISEEEASILRDTPGVRSVERRKAFLLSAPPAMEKTAMEKTVSTRTELGVDSLPYSGKNVVVGAIIDGGVNFNHPSFAPMTLDDDEEAFDAFTQDECHLPNGMLCNNKVLTCQVFSNVDSGDDAFCLCVLQLPSSREQSMSLIYRHDLQGP
jgi:hypothetical protein